MTNGNGAPNRLFVFGWDCADWTVIEEGWRRGMLQNLRALADRGESGTLMSTVPPVTAPAWTSFLTGKDPGEHGIFGFRTVDPVDYRSVVIPGGRRRGVTLIKLCLTTPAIAHVWSLFLGPTRPSRLRMVPSCQGGTHLTNRSKVVTPLTLRGTWKESSSGSRDVIQGARAPRAFSNVSGRTSPCESASVAISSRRGTRRSS